MAEKDSTKLSSVIKEELDQVLRAGQVLISLAQIAQEADNETFTLSTETIFRLGCSIDANVDGIIHKLDHEPQAAAQGGE